MGLLFDRKYSLTIADPTKNDSAIKNVPDYLLLQKASEKTPISEGTLDTIEQTSADWRTSSKNGVVIDDLQITASIKGNANTSSNSNSSIIKIFNLSKQTRGVIEKKGNYVILRAGYAQDEELRIIFVGQVEEFETARQGSDLVTTLKCIDGQMPTNSVRISKKFSRDNTYGDVINYLVDTYERNGIARGDVVLGGWEYPPTDYTQLPVIKNNPFGYLLVNGFSCTGFLHQVLDNICKQMGYVSYITNGKIFVHPKGYTSTVEQYEFTSKQMKSIRKSGSTTSNTSISDGLDGIKIITFLDGRLDIDKRVKILDGDHQGTYKIITKSHELDYKFGSWDSTITCTKIKEGA